MCTNRERSLRHAIETKKEVTKYDVMSDNIYGRACTYQTIQTLKWTDLGGHTQTGDSGFSSWKGRWSEEF